MVRGVLCRYTKKHGIQTQANCAVLDKTTIYTQRSVKNPGIHVQRVACVPLASKLKRNELFTEKFTEKDKANDILRYLIKVSRGFGFKSPLRVRLAVLIMLKEDLENLHAIWQVERARNFIHLFLKNNKDVLHSENDTLKVKGGLSKGRKPQKAVLCWYKDVPDGSGPDGPDPDGSENTTETNTEIKIVSKKQGGA